MACLVMLINLASAQNTITGKVFDKETKEALPGVPVYIPGTTIGTTTSANGEFTLTSEQSFDSIEVKFVGYQTQKIKVEQGKNINVELASSTIR